MLWSSCIGGRYMNFIWDIILQAQKEGKEKSDLFFWQAQDYSPYYEQSFNTINEEHIDKNLIEINALYRFSHIFQEILHPNFIQNGQYADVIAFIIYLFDTVIHYLGEIDLRHGFTKREFYIRRICYEVKNGVFGKTAQDGILTMDKTLQLKIANEILTQMQIGSNLHCFKRAIKDTFPNCILYQSNYNAKELFLYLGEKNSEPKEKQLVFLLDCFLPLEFQIRIFWDKHFGIMGIDETMHSNEIVIF